MFLYCSLYGQALSYGCGQEGKFPEAYGGNKMKTKQVGDVKITLCLTEEEGLCIQDGGKWLLMCETHGGIVQDTNKSRLWAWASTPEEWCSECKRKAVA